MSELPLGNPVHNIRKPKSGESRQRRLTADEWTKLEVACKQSRNTWLHPALLLAVETAMRQGELLALKRADIDKGKRTAWLKETKNGEPRAVPLTSRAIAVIEGLPRSTTGLLVPVEKQALHSAFRTACRRAGIDDYRWHDLRHEALSRFAERGDLSVLELAAISGHKSASAMLNSFCATSSILASRSSSVLTVAPETRGAFSGSLYRGSGSCILSSR